MMTTTTDRLARVIARVRDRRGEIAAERLLRRLAAAGHGEIQDDPWHGTVLVPEPGQWWAESDGYPTDGPWDSADEALREYAEGCDWPTEPRTWWLHVAAFRRGIDARGDDVQVDLVGDHVAMAPPEPPCIDGGEHEWASPHEIVGGCRENPGVTGHGGGVIIREVCTRCGCGRTTDTWAHCSSCGAQGLTAVAYSPGEHAGDVLPQAVQDLAELADPDMCETAREAASWLAVAIRDGDVPPADRPRLSRLDDDQWTRLRAAAESLAAPGHAPVVRTQDDTERAILREAVRLARTY